MSQRSVLLAALAATAMFASAAAAHPGRTNLAPAHGSGLIKVHDADDEYRWHRHHRRHHSVDAPYTRVEAGRRVIVDAPFASVYVGREGRHIRAPFVNLWVPR